MPISLSEIHHLVVADGIDNLVCELFGREVSDPEIGSLRHMIGNGIEEVGLTQTNSAIDKERVICSRWLLCYSHTGGMSKLVSSSDDKILKCVFGIELNPSLRPDRCGCLHRLCQHPWIGRPWRYLVYHHKRNSGFTPSTSIGNSLLQK